MYSQKSNELEQEVVKVLGEKSHFAISLIRSGDKGYFTRIEANGFPFVIQAFESTVEKSEELAIDGFRKHMSKALEKDMFHSQPEENYWDIEVLKEDVDKLYDDMEIYPLEMLNKVKAHTTIKMCKLENGNYECVIDCDEMRIHVRHTCPLERFAKKFAIYKARDVMRPRTEFVGNRELRFQN